MSFLKTILLPTDFSEEADYAFSLACVLAREQGARLILLHVVPRSGSVNSGAPAHKAQHAEADVKAYRDEMTRFLDKVREQAPYAKVEPLLLEGEVAKTITQTAEGIPCDLVVMGSHGASRMYELMMGSVVQQVTRSATCPVLAVKLPRKH